MTSETEPTASASSAEPQPAGIRPIASLDGGATPIARAYQHIIRDGQYRPVKSVQALVVGAALMAAWLWFTVVPLRTFSPGPRAAAAVAVDLVTVLLLGAVYWWSFGWQPRWLISVTGGWRRKVLLWSLGAGAVTALVWCVSRHTRPPITVVCWMAGALVVGVAQGWFVQVVGAMLRQPQVGLAVPAVIAAALVTVAIHRFVDLAGQSRAVPALLLGAVSLVLSVAIWWTGGLEVVAGLAFVAAILDVSSISVFAALAVLYLVVAAWTARTWGGAQRYYHPPVG